MAHAPQSNGSFRQRAAARELRQRIAAGNRSRASVQGTDTFPGRAVWLASIVALSAVAAVAWYLHREHLLPGLFADSPNGSAQVVVPDPAPELPPPLPGGDASVSTTPLKLLLVGTTLGPRPEDSTAALGTSRRNPQTYGPGALLANGARIATIAADHIVLERDGERFRIDVSQDPTGALGSVEGRAGAIDTVGGAVASASAPTEAMSPVTDVVRPRPVYDEAGQFVAYELYPGRNDAAFEALGLQPGDRLLAADGVSLASVEQSAALLQTLAAGTAVSASIERGGQVVALRLDGRNFAGHDAAGAASNGSDQAQ